jgi:hypothetical protein
MFSSRCILQRHLGRDWYHADPLNRPCGGKIPVIGWLGGLHFPARTRVKAPPGQAQEERSNRLFPQSHPPWSATGAHVGKQRQTSRRFKTCAINCLTALSSIHTSLSPPLSLSFSPSLAGGCSASAGIGSPRNRCSFIAVPRSAAGYYGRRSGFPDYTATSSSYGGLQMAVSPYKSIIPYLCATDLLGYR